MQARAHPVGVGPPGQFGAGPRPLRGEWRWAALSGLAVCLAAVAPYLSTLDGAFLSDDFGLVWLLSGKGPLHVLTLFASPWTETIYGGRTDELRPVLALTYQLDALWGAARPVGYHATNVLLHALTSLLVLATARRVAGLSWPAACFAGTLFAVLPIHAETVAWISGRADSLPTLLYLGSFLLYALWRRAHGPGAPEGSRSEATASPVQAGRRSGWLYWSSVALFFLALYTKQSAITMVATLALYDAFVAGALRFPPPRSGGALRGWLRPLAPYVPYAVLTAGYLALRYALFGQAVREDTLTLGTLISYPSNQAAHLQILAFGAVLAPAGRATSALALLALAGAAVLIAVALRRSVLGAGSGHRRETGESPWRTGARPGRERWETALYFGPAWWLVGTAPLLMTYISARHLYLASAGVAISVAIGLEAAWSRMAGTAAHADGRGGPGGRLLRRRWAAALAAAGLLGACALRLPPSVAEWNGAAAVSGKMAADVVAESAAAPRGSLLVLGAPHKGPGRATFTWIWGYALPYALRPPFTAADVQDRVSIVEPPLVWCCGRDQWLERTRRTVAAWAARPERPPAVLLLWDPATGALARRTEAEDPTLREGLLGLTAAGDARETCRALVALLSRAGRWAQGCSLVLDGYTAPLGAGQG